MLCGTSGRSAGELFKHQRRSKEAAAWAGGSPAAGFTWIPQMKSWEWCCALGWGLHTAPLALKPCFPSGRGRCHSWPPARMLTVHFCFQGLPGQATGLVQASASTGSSPLPHPCSVRPAGPKTLLKKETRNRPLTEISHKTEKTAAER